MEDNKSRPPLLISPPSLPSLSHDLLSVKSLQNSEHEIISIKQSADASSNCCKATIRIDCFSPLNCYAEQQQRADHFSASSDCCSSGASEQFFLTSDHSLCSSASASSKPQHGIDLDHIGGKCANIKLTKTHTSVFSHFCTSFHQDSNR